MTIELPCSLCGTLMEVGVRITSTSPLQGASLFECPCCGHHFEITYDVTKKRHIDG